MMDQIESLRELSELDRIIHEPSRLILVAILYAVEKADFTFLQNQSGLTRGNLSSHLSRLEDAGYVEIEKTYRGKVPLTLCSLTPKGRAAFEAYRKRLSHLTSE
jgi:DNA-binding MarR family transcriptional regulator